MSNSESVRQIGNKCFSEFKKCVSQSGKKEYLEKALACYTDALQMAQRLKAHDDMKSAAKNLFFCHFYLYDLQSNLTTKQFCLTEGMKFASVAIHHHRVSQPDASAINEWLTSILDKIESHISHAWIHSDKLSVEEKIKFIFVFGTNFNKDQLCEHESKIITQFRLDQTNFTISLGMQYVIDKDFKRGLHLIHEAYFPLQETLRLTKENSQDLHILQSEYHTFKSLGEALQSYYLAVDILDQALNSEEELQMEIVWDALDQFHQAKSLSRGESVEFICMAQAQIGRIYSKILKNDLKAKSYFQECINLAHTLEKNNYEDDWYVAASRNLREIQEKFQKREEETWENERKKYLEELKDEIKDLDEKNYLEHKEYLVFLSESYPPKHKRNFKNLFKKALEEPKEKKILQKVITFYHTDKISKDDMTYYVLCDEICKRLTSRYQTIKECE